MGFAQFMSSGLGRDVASMIAADPHVATGPDGRPVNAGARPFVIGFIAVLLIRTLRVGSKQIQVQPVAPVALDRQAEAAGI